MNDIAVLILAAGASSRSAPRDKLADIIENEPMLRHVTQTYLGAKLSEIYVVLGGKYASTRRQSLKGIDVHILEFSGAENGMGETIAYGVSQLHKQFKSVMIGLADMPKVDHELIRLLANAHQKGTITAPISNGRRGHPVIFDHAYFSELRELSGDFGARSVIESNKEKLRLVDGASGACLFDIDT